MKYEYEEIIHINKFSEYFSYSTLTSDRDLTIIFIMKPNGLMHCSSNSFIINLLTIKMWATNYYTFKTM